MARDYPMPQLAVGDVVVSPLMGAYTMVSASRFNGIPATPVVVARHGADGVETVVGKRPLPGKVCRPITSVAVPP